MAPEAVIAGRAYHLLKADLVAGRFKPGEIIVERTFAAELGISIAPLRDGAQRLVGEGLLEPAPRGGYRLPELTEDDLCDLYQWHDHLVRLIVKSAEPADTFLPAIRSGAEFTAEQIANAASELFRSIADVARNQEHARALLIANDRLQAIRRVEAMALPNLVDEFVQLRSGLHRGPDRDRIGKLWAYHRRRIRRVDKIISGLRVE
jgi:DNA-binding GntR family transcriptional regulator